MKVSAGYSILDKLNYYSLIAVIQMARAWVTEFIEEVATPCLYITIVELSKPGTASTAALASLKTQSEFTLSKELTQLI